MPAPSLSSSDRPARVMLALAGIFFTALSIGLWRDPGVPWMWRFAGLALGCAGAVRPDVSLLLIIVVLPIATPLSDALQAPFSPTVAIELLLIPMIAGVSIAQSAARTVVPPSRLLWPAVAFGAVALGAGILGVAIDQHGGMNASQVLQAIWAHVSQRYASDAAGACSTIHVAMTWVEGLALAVLIEIVSRRYPAAASQMLRAFVVAGAAAAIFPIVRLIQISVARPEPWHAAFEFLHTLRTSPHYPDLNAAGSYYALVLLPALWGALHARWRWMWVPTVLIVTGLWLTGSRSAIVGVLAGAAAISVTSRQHLRWLIAIVLTLAVGAWLVTRSAGRYQAPASAAIAVRIDLARIALQITARHPWFGAGLAQFPSSSLRYLTDDLVTQFPEAGKGENAHNNYLQVLAEMGIIGLACLTWAVLLPVAAAVRDSAVGKDPRLAAITGGLVALLGSALAGHPWLTAPVWLATAMAIGIALGLRPAPDARTFARRDGLARDAAIVMVLIVLASLPARLSRALPHVEITHGQTSSSGHNVRTRHASPVSLGRHTDWPDGESSPRG